VLELLTLEAEADSEAFVVDGELDVVAVVTIPAVVVTAVFAAVVAAGPDAVLEADARRSPSNAAGFQTVLQSPAGSLSISCY
jgi:hypothetical protein